MKILISNDDGIDAIGIQILAEVINKDHEVLVVAPDSERSAASHGLVSMRGIRYKEDRRFKFKAYACSGLPADCVKLGVLHLLNREKPDLILSGINNGTNLGTDVIYSGTVSAALEGIYMGIPGIAVSAAYKTTKESYREVAEFVRKNLDKLIALNLPITSALNINYPTDREVKGAKIAPLGRHRYTDGFNPFEDGYRLEGYSLPLEDHETDCDIYWYNKGYIALSPIQNDRNDYLTLKRIKGDL